MRVVRAVGENQIIESLAEIQPGDVVEYHRGPTLKGCHHGWFLWDLALRGECHLVQKRYGEFDFGYWAIKAQHKIPLSEKFHYLGRDIRGRPYRSEDGRFARRGGHVVQAPSGGAGETEGGLA